MSAHVALYGRLGRDPETSTAASGKDWTSATMAVDVTPSNAEDAATWWVRVAAFGRQAETLARHRKGDLLAVQGRLARSDWADAEGNARQSWEVVAESIVSARAVRPGGTRKRPEAQPEVEDPSDALPF
jgi:single stranded DNA-binding protein